MARRRTLSTLAVLLLSTSMPKAEPSPKEMEIVTNFEAICISNANIPNIIPRLLTAKGTPEASQFSTDIAAPPPISGAFKALLMPLQGKSFKFKDNDMMLTISITDTGACSLLSPDAHGDVIEALLKDQLFTAQIGKEISGGIAHITYAVSLPTPAETIHTLIFIDRPLRLNSPGVRLSSLGEAYLRARVQKEPEWPALPSPSDQKQP
jgi:hypothetical protein